ncbi:MAG: cytochrome c4 [Candidatus Rokubacteria bacterium]|nr:cytochrome c4 [Candidatus Rokubacteria bacterium]
MRHALAALVSLALLVPVATSAQFSISGDAAAGRRKAEACVPCHGPRGKSTRPDAPSLAGQVPLYTYFQLFQFRAGRRQNAEMAPAVASLSDQDMQDLAAYFASEPASPRHEAFDETKAAAGRLASNAHACEGCHRPGFAGYQHVPRLTGLSREYVVAQLRGYKAQTRADYDGAMTGTAQPLSDRDIENLGHYVSAVATTAPAESSN